MLPGDHFGTIRDTLDDDFYLCLDITLQLVSVVSIDLDVLVRVDQVGQSQPSDEFISDHVEGGLLVDYQFFLGIIDLKD